MTSDAPREHTHRASTIVTMQLGVALMVLLGLVFFSGGLFYLYTFNADIGPYFTATRAIHFYAGLASVPFLFAKYGSTLFRFAGYYLRLPRFHADGPPRFVPRLLSPLLALDFFVLYFSGAYMLFHYYYTVTNIPPAEFKPVQVHLWASILAVPLLGAHLGSHLLETLRALALERRELRGAEARGEAVPSRAMTRRAFVGTVAAGGLGLAFALQNTPLANREVRGLFIGRIPESERGGPGDFPVETLFGKREIDLDSWRLVIEGGAASERVELDYASLLALPAVTRTIRISCVSGWTAVPTWTGPRVRDVLALAGAREAARADLHSVSEYRVSWHLDRLLGDDALLATHVNGAPLSVDHGFPVRLIVAGYPGQSMVKQLDRIGLEREPVRFDPDFRLIRAITSSSCGTSEGVA